MLMRHGCLIIPYMESKLLNNIEQFVDIGATFELRVTGFSMLPLLGYGNDKIIIRRTGEKEIIDNRIAMFRTDQGKIIVHRVVALEDGVVKLKGDGNIYGYEYCNREKIVGVVESVVRQNGRVVSCVSKLWRIREKIWLSQPLIIRRFALAIMRFWLKFKKK